MRSLLDQPLQDRVEIGLLLRADTIAADFPMRDGLHVKCIDQFVHRKFVGQVRLVAQNEKRYAVENPLIEQSMQLLLGDRESVVISSIDNVSAER